MDDSVPPGVNGESDSWFAWFDPFGAASDAVGSVWSSAGDTVGGVYESAGSAASETIASIGNAIGAALGGGVAGVLESAGVAGANIAGATALSAAAGLVVPIVAIAGILIFGPKVAKIVGKWI